MDDLSQYREQFAQILGDVEKLLGSLTEEQLRWRPRPNSWCVSENLLHLIKTGDLYFPALDKAIQQARAAGWTAGGPFRYGLVGRLLVRLVSPPVRMKVAAPKPFHPHSAEPKAQVLERFRQLHKHWEQRLEAARGLDLKRIRVGSPSSDRLKMSLGIAFAVMVAHERRHLWQAGRVVADPQFPAPQRQSAATTS